MKKKLLVTLTSLTLAMVITACTSQAKTPVENTPETNSGVKEFATEYEMKGTTSAGVPKSDTFVFEGTTEDDIITTLNFDIIRDKGTDKELSKKDIMGYQMNVSDAVVEKVGDDFKLTKLSSAGWSDELGGQYMILSFSDIINDSTKFKDLTITDISGQTVIETDKALSGYGYIATEAGIQDFNEETLLKDMLIKYDLYKDGSFVEGTKRISFAGYNGGRSYGEQIDSIVAHILKEKMTLEEVYEMFKTTNPMEQPISERDAISGATITFVGDFQRMVYLAMHGEMFEGVITDTQRDDGTRVEVTTQGYGGEVVTHITFDSSGKIIKIVTRDAHETPELGGALTEEDSDFIKSLISGQDDLDKVELVSGATKTSEALVKAVKLATEYFKSL